MHIVEQLREEYADLDPIIILAPSQRCGSTLLQRMINAGGETILYGENFYMCETLPRSIGDIAVRVEQKQEITAPLLERFIEGERSMDATALFPDYELYAEQVLRSFFELLAFYRRESMRHGFNHWGFKYQIRDSRGANNFFALLPRCRLVTINRDVTAVARSHLARWPDQWRDTSAFETFGRRWASHTEFIRKLHTPRLELQLETMTESPDMVVEQLEQWLGVRVSAQEIHKKPALSQSVEIPPAGLKSLLIGAGEVYAAYQKKPLAA